MRQLPPTDGFKSAQQPKTFKGDRGGSAEDDELLAALRAISAKSSSVDRFQEDENGTSSADDMIHGGAESHNMVSKKEKKKKLKKTKTSVAKVTPCENTAVVKPAKPLNGGAESHNMISKKKKKKELKKAKTSVAKVTPCENTEVVKSAKPLKSKAPTQDRDSGQSHLSNDRNVISKVDPQLETAKMDQVKRNVAADADADAAREEVRNAELSSAELSDGSRTKPEELRVRATSISSFGSNYQSGDEEDYEILAELQAMDMDTGQEDSGVKNFYHPGESKEKFTELDLSPSNDSDQLHCAEDDELLAELQAIDADAALDAEQDFHSSRKPVSPLPIICEVDSTAEKQEGDEDCASVEISHETRTKPKGSTGESIGQLLQPSKNKLQINLPPWKKKGGKAKAKKANPFNNEDYFQNSLPKTFKGDRGGSAEDDELLAELRAISAKSGSANRFEEGNDTALSAENSTSISKAVSPPKKVAPVHGDGDGDGDATKSLGAPSTNGRIKEKAIVSTTKKISTSSPLSMDGTAEEIIVKIENIEDALNSKQWKMRKAAYAMMKSLLSEKVEGQEGTNDLDGSIIVPSLNHIIVKIVRETNISALDEALSFAILYADYCKDASQAEHAADICSNLLNGPALSSRPTTVKRAKELIIKLMEVGRSGYCSIHSVVELLLTDGLNSKKPKVVLNSTSLVLEAVQAFGAPTLPLGIVSSNASKALSHTNKEVRENGLKLIAELCRSMGSKDALENVISSMKSAQKSDLDILLKEQEQPSPPSIGLRFQKKSPNPSLAPSAEMVATLKAASKGETAKKFASRTAVDLIKKINETDFESKINKPKWSEKVAALDILILSGGLKPYKLCQPAPSIDYGPLIRNLNQLVGHTHFAVKSKSLTALGMLAEGVGAKLFTHLRPLLYTVLELLKDKKVARASYSCLDSFFGNVVGFDNLLEKENAIPSAVNEKAHPLVRKGALEFMGRCIERSDTAGPRGSIDTGISGSIIKVCCDKLSDQDAGVRKEACNVLNLLQNNENTKIKAFTERRVKSLEKTNPRAYKTLLQATSETVVGETSHSKELNLPKAMKKATPTVSKKNSSLNRGDRANRKSSKLLSSTDEIQTKSTQSNNTTSDFVVDIDEGNIPSVEDSLEFLSKLSIPNWDVAEDAGGVLSGLKSTKWMFRKKAIDSLVIFLRSAEAKEADPSCSMHILVFIKACTKNFKESNFNLVKCLIEIFQAVCDLYLTVKRQLEVWICEAAIVIAVGKISDKKLTNGASKLLSSLCEVQLPDVIFALSIKIVKPLKSPLPHEGLLTWCKGYCDGFGAFTLRKSIHTCVNWALEECGSTNVDTRAAALVLLGEMHTQIGPALKALVMSNSGLESSVKTKVESLLISSPFNSTASKVSREKKSFVIDDGNNGTDDSESSDLPSAAIEIPKTDLVAILPSKCLSRMAAKEGKIAWKIRKEALDEVEKACLQSTGIFITSPNRMKGLIELCMALNERLADLQGNLKPLAARNIAHVLGSVDSVSQAKLSRIVCRSLIHAAMNDNKKPMRDACIDALEKCTDKIDIEGGGVNPLSMKSFMSAVLAEVGDSEYKAIGLPTILELAAKKAEYFPRLDHISTTKGKVLESQFAAMTVGCLTSSKTETRYAAESLIAKCLKFHTLSPQSIEKGIAKLTQAAQRNVRLILNSLDIDKTQNIRNVHTSGNPRKGSPTKQLSPRRSVEEKISNGSEHSPSRPLARTNRDSNSLPERDNNPSSASLNDLLNDPHFFPLISNNGLTSTKAQRTSKSMRTSDTWPEYPEEPSGKDLLKTLRQVWAPLLPPASIDILFPSGGILRQDDSSRGCALISHALTVLQANGQENVLIDQLDLVNKWLAFAVCSRENTIGMEALTSFLLKLFSFLKQTQYQMTDMESRILFPFLLEKAGVAKERFRDTLLDLLLSLASDDIYPLAKYGSITCLSVIEMSTFPKTRLLATRQCLLCVEKCGLTGIGKKGIQLVAKSLSNEQNSENRTAYLDLIEIIIKKMNGDMQKCFKLCGSSTLSGRAREMIEDRWLRSGNATSSRTNKRPISAQSRSTRSSNRLEMLKSNRAASTSKLMFTTKKSSLLHELPSLNSKVSKNERSNDAVLTSSYSDDSRATFKFSYRKTEDTSPENQISPNDTGNMVPLREQMRKISVQRRSEKVFNRIMCDVDDLLSQPTPLGDKESISLVAVTGLRMLHSSLTTNGVVQLDTIEFDLQELRSTVKDNLPYCVARLTSVLGFGFRCGTALTPDGLSTPLFSASIAGLMAIFSDPRLSMLIPEEVLILVIRRAASGLLDRRLGGNLKGSNHGLDVSTVAKIAKAINKLAIQATLGVKRHISLQSLLSLQLQICSACVKEGVAITDVSNIHNRMSRIITTLFLRVIQIEENEPFPFSGEDIDLISLIGSLECFLKKTRFAKGVTVSFPQSVSRGVVDSAYVCDDRMVPLLTMGRNLMLHLLKSKEHQAKLKEVEDVIDCLELSEISLTNRLYCNCRDELGFGNSQTNEYDTDQLSELIFNIGRADDSEEKMYAFDDLREFIHQNGDIDIEPHLSSLSAPFRNYVLNELNDPTPFRPPMSSDSRSILSGYSGESSQSPSVSRYSTSDSHVLRSTRSLLSTYSDDSSRSLQSGCSYDRENTISATESMTERVRKLKSKINAVKATAQSLIDLNVVNESDDSNESGPSNLRHASTYQRKKTR